MNIPTPSETERQGAVSCSAWLERLSRRTALKAIALGAAGWVVGVEPETKAQYVIGIDPASEEKDHYVECVMRLEPGGKVVLVRCSRRSND